MAFTVSRTVEFAASMEAVRPLLRDLSTYPKWVPIVSSVTQDGEQHWIVELRVSIGPFARSKQLRMERSVDNDEHIMFTRNESDGRQHAHWELRFDMSDVGSQTSVTAVLEYRGTMWTPGPVEDALHNGLDAAVEQFRELLQQTQ
jgi:carbon monoxide dehydrogenase subunit G